MSLESKFPPALFAAGVLALGYGLIEDTGARRLVIVLYLLWTLLELPVTLRQERGGPGTKTGGDRGSMPLYGLARASVVAAAIFAPAPAGPAPRLLAAIAVFVFGVGLRLGAIVQLGRFYSHRVRTLPDHAIVQTGLYRFVRHPAYAGMILAHAGFAGVFPNPFSVAALLGLLVPAVVYRILVEEHSLMSLSGYRAYARDRKRLIPAVW